MIENARRQLILVLLTIVASLACIVTLKPVWGADLKGGTSLSYVIPEEVLKKLEKDGTPRQKVLEQTCSVINERADPTGTLDVLVTPKGDSEILVEVPWIDDLAERRATEARISSLGKLEMRVVANADYNAPGVQFDLAEERRRVEEWLKNPEHKKLLYEKPLEIRQFNQDPGKGPKAVGKLFWYPYLMRPVTGNQGERLWDRSESNNQFMSGSVVKAYDDAEFNGGVVPEGKPKDAYLIELIAINMDEEWFSGADLNPGGISAGTSDSGGPAVNYVIADTKQARYAAWSEKYIQKCSAIILNDVVKSAPYFRGRIPGFGQISGNFTQEEVTELVKVLRTGSLRVEPELQSRSEIGPNLGQDAIDKGLLSLVIGSLAVFAFMLWYYRLAGIVACVTLVLNVLLLWGAMVFMRATITLPGLGGIVLTLGMAVDANVLIYERIREEMERGKDMLRAVRAGFERAMSAILDSNITTFLAGLILYNVGVGPVRGFAVTLMMGIVTTVFTQFFVTRLCFHWVLETKRLVTFNVRRLMSTPNINFVKYAKPCFVASIVAIAAGLVLVFTIVPKATLLGMDFTGGANLRMVVSAPMAADEIRTRLTGDEEYQRTFDNVSINTVDAVTDGKATKFNLRLKLTDELRATIEKERAAARQRRAEALAAGAQAPDAYKPLYVRLLERVFAADLVKPAASGAIVVPSPEPGQPSFAQIQLHLAKPVDVAKAKELLAAAKLFNADVQVLDEPGATTGRNLFVEWSTMPTTRDWELFEQVRKALESLKDVDGGKLTLSDPFPEAQEIQGRMVVELRNAAIGALVLSWIMMVLYLRVRFHEYAYGIAAVVALVHDVFVAFIVVALANYSGLVHAEVNLSMIACFLTIIGYSVNDTIVIFDRIRENLTENKRTGVQEAFGHLINRAVNQTLSRTILTSGVTLFVVLAQFLVNAQSESDLGSFAFGMLVGMVSGVYSTVFIAAPILIWLKADRHTEALVKMTPAPGDPEAIEQEMLEKPPVQK